MFNITEILNEVTKGNPLEVGPLFRHGHGVVHFGRRRPRQDSSCSCQDKHLPTKNENRNSANHAAFRSEP